MSCFKSADVARVNTRRRHALLRVGAAALALSRLATAAAAALEFEEALPPSLTDIRIEIANAPHLLIMPVPTATRAELVVFLPGTNATPENDLRILRFIAAQGFRVIGLSYPNASSVAELCENNSVASCSADIRSRAVFGKPTPVDAGPGDPNSIVNRLQKALIYLDRHRPHQRWSDYIDADHPTWSRVILSGMSQGAGMAAYLAKYIAVARVVLFSGPWDGDAASAMPDGWLSQQSATPRERWFAAYHRRERTALQIAASYSVLAIPGAHILIFNRPVPPEAERRQFNPFHASVIGLRAYESEWRALFVQSGP
jgi:hypothetical protein